MTYIAISATARLVSPENAANDVRSANTSRPPQGWKNLGF